MSDSSIEECRGEDPCRMQAEIRDGYWAVFDTKSLKTEPGPRPVELTGHRLTEFAKRYAATYRRR
jgi:hypothetical protein